MQAFDQEQWAQDEALVATARKLGMKATEVSEIWHGRDGYLRARTTDGNITVFVPDDEPDENGNAGPLIDPTSRARPMTGVPIYEPFKGARTGPDAAAARSALEARREVVHGHVASLTAELHAFREENLRGDNGLPSATDELKAQEKALKSVIAPWSRELGEIDEKLNPKRPSDTYLTATRAAYLWSIAEDDDELGRICALNPGMGGWPRSPDGIANERKVSEAVFERWNIPLPTFDEVRSLAVQGATPRPRQYNFPTPEPPAPVEPAPPEFGGYTNTGASAREGH